MTRDTNSSRALVYGRYCCVSSWLYSYVCFAFLRFYIVSSGFDILQEVDPTVENEEVGGADGMDGLFSELANAIPGIDEAMSFAEMLK